VAVPVLRATPGTVEPTVAHPPRPAGPSAPLLPPPALGSVERATTTPAPRPPAARAPVLPAPAVTSRPAGNGRAEAPDRGNSADAAPGRSQGQPDRTVDAAPDHTAPGVPVGAVHAAGDEAVAVHGAVPMVYATTGGKRFHREGCRLAGTSARPLPRAEAEAGGLAPCGACRP